MDLGVKRGTVRITPYNELWAEIFLCEKERLTGIFGSKILHIEHIGSTSIPNLKSKPLIDIAIQVVDINDLGKITPQLLDIGYEERVGRLQGKQLVFAKGGDANITHHLHIIEKGEKDWDEKIKFRNILLSNPNIVTDYAQLKEELFSKYPNDRHMYTTSKTSFIKNILDQENKY